jgi:hypothetical protein
LHGRLERPEGREAFFAEAAEFFSVEGGEGVESGLSELGEGESLAAVVVGIGDALEEASSFGSVYEFDGGVVTEFEPVGYFADGGGLAGVGTADG